MSVVKRFKLRYLDCHVKCPKKAKVTNVGHVNSEVGNTGKSMKLIGGDCRDDIRNPTNPRL